MGNAPLLTGLGGGRTHRVRYYDDTEGSSRGYRPEGIPAENMETQVLEQIEEESVGGDSEIEALEPSVGHTRYVSDCQLESACTDRFAEPHIGFPQKIFAVLDVTMSSLH